MPFVGNSAVGKDDIYKNSIFTETGRITSRIKRAIASCN
jgi:hypothetical protein